MEKKVGRNDPCPCGSGKKYKNCHYGKETEKKPTYTPTGKRKFTAKVISVSDKSQAVFQSIPPIPTAAEPMENLKFDQTKTSYQVKDKGQTSFKREENEKTPESQKGAPELPPGGFDQTKTDFREKKKD